MKIERRPRFPADPGLLIRKLTDLFASLAETTLGDLNGVSLSGTTAGQVLQYDGTNWVNSASAGGATWTEAEVDFGSSPVYSARFTITDASISGTSKMQVLPCGKAATGRTADDWEWDGATFAANPGAGSATCYAVFTPGPIVGKRKIQYSVA